MSGGHWDYIQFGLEDVADELKEGDLKQEKEFGVLLTEINKLIDKSDLWKSGDTSEKEFTKEWNKFKRKWLKEIK